MFQMFDRTKGYASKIVGKPFELGLNDFDSVKNLSQETIPKPVLIGDDVMKIPISARNYSNCTVTTHLDYK